MKYKLKKEDFERTFKFGVEYHLDPRKSSSTRTAGSARGLGGVLDSFMHGKLVETGVIQIINDLNLNKILLADFDIKGTNEAKDDPDIVKIIEKKNERLPKIYVEIKNISQDDRYIGLTYEQFNTAKKTSNNRDIFIVGAHLENSSKNSSKKINDALGVYLKKK